MKMTVRDFLDVIDPDRMEDNQILEICRDGWNRFDLVATSSRMLEFVEGMEIIAISATGEDRFRIQLKELQEE